jgi:hypothetical protein
MMLEILRFLSESLTSIGDLTPIETFLAAAEVGGAVVALSLLRATTRHPAVASQPAHTPDLRQAA